MRTKSIRLLCCCAAAVLLLCGCGKDDSNQFSGGAGTTTPANAQTQAQPIATGNGFVHAHAVEAGFGMGSDTSEDIIARLSAIAQPDMVDTREYPTMTVTTVEYPFGVFEFQSTDDSQPVLTYVDITGKLSGPCGVSIGDALTEAAEQMYTGSDALLAANTEQELRFYGEAGGIPRGLYYMLTAEFTSSTTPELYALEYVDQSYDPDYFTRFTMYFGEQSTMVRYNLRYESLG